MNIIKWRVNLGSQSNAHAMFKRTGAEVQRSYNTRQYGKFMATYILTEICWRKDNKRGWKSIWTFLLVVFGQGEKEKKKTTSGKYFSYQHDTFESLQGILSAHKVTGSVSVSWMDSTWLHQITRRCWIGRPGGVKGSESNWC